MSRLATRIAVSVVAAAATLLAFFLLLIAFGGVQSLFSTGSTRLLVMATLVLVACGTAMLRPIVPLAYALTLALLFPLTVVALTASNPSNLAGFVLWVSVIVGISVAVPVALVGTFAHMWPTPRWAPFIVAGAGVASCIVLQVWSQSQIIDHEQAAMERIRQIRDAEEAFAAQRPDHAYTCNGPDLPLQGIDWRNNVALGTSQKNEAQLKGYWIYLTCQASAHPRYFSIQAIATDGSRRTFQLDSNGQFTPPHYR